MDDEGHITTLPERPSEPTTEQQEETEYSKLIEESVKRARLRNEAIVIERLSRQGVMQRLKELELDGERVREPKVTREDVDREIARYNELMPHNDRELREGLDRSAAQVISAAEAEKKHREHVPDIVLRHLNEADYAEGWQDITGWEDATQRARVLEMLSKRLGFKVYRNSNGEVERYSTQAIQAMHSLIGSGKTAQEALAVLDDEERLEKKKRDYEAKANDMTNEMFSKMGESAGHMRGVSTDKEMVVKYLYVYDELGIKQPDWIRRFILDKEFKSSLNQEYDSSMPQNLFDLAWNLSHNFPEYDIDGLYPVLQMQVKKGPNGKIEGRYVVNQGNFNRWFRFQQWRWYETFDTQSVTDYFSKIELHKGPMYNVNLITMLFDKERYFRDETGYQWEGLYNQTLMEPWMMLFLRTYAVELDQVDDDIGKLKDKYKELFHLSKLTMGLGGLGTSMIERLTTLPVDFDGEKSDTRVGEAMLKMLLTYYHMADFEALQETLGEDSRFFTRDGWIEALAKISKGTTERTHMFAPGTSFGEHQDFFNNAFGEDGKIKNQKAFMKFINIYESAHKPETLVHTFDQIVKDCVAESLVSKEGNSNAEGATTNKEGKVLDSLSLDYAWLIANSLTFPSGATARGNFPAVSGHKAETRYFYTDAYRLKYMGFGGAGAYATIHMFPQTSLPFFEGIILENKFDTYSYYDEKKGQMVTKKRHWTPMELMQKLNSTNNAFEARRKALRDKLEQTDSKDEKDRIMRQIAEVDEEAKNLTKQNALHFAFNQNAMREWAKNLHGRGADLYDQLMKGTETAFDKFTVYDGIFRGPSFKQDEWQDALQTKYITPLRYLFEANGATQLNARQHFPEYKGQDKDGNPIWEWREMYVGERMLGHQVVDIPTFRMRRRDLTEAKWIEMRRQGYKEKGKYVVRPDGRYMINYDRVQDNKKMVYKQWLLTKIAGDLHHHISRHTTDPQYSLEHFESIIKAIEELPGNLLGNQYDLRGNLVTKPFFSHEQIAWLRKVSGANTKWRTEWWKALVMGDPHKKGGGIGESTNLIIGAIFKGY